MTLNFIIDTFLEFIRLSYWIHLVFSLNNNRKNQLLLIFVFLVKQYEVIRCAWKKIISFLFSHFLLFFQRMIKKGHIRSFWTLKSSILYLNEVYISGFFFHLFIFFLIHSFIDSFPPVSPSLTRGGIIQSSQGYQSSNTGSKHESKCICNYNLRYNYNFEMKNRV